MPRKVYQLDKNTWSIGVFYNGEMLKGSSPRYYKTRAGADRALARLMRG